MQDNAFDLIFADFLEKINALPSRSRLSDADTKVLYAYAYELLQQGNFEKADGYFSLLTIYRPTEVRFLAGQGLVHKMLKRYDEAITVYGFITLLEPAQPLHHLCIVECQLLQGKMQDAFDTLETVMQLCDQGEGHEKTRARAQAIASLLSGANVGA